MLRFWVLGAGLVLASKWADSIPQHFAKHPFAPTSDQAIVNIAVDVDVAAGW